ncbi:MgtC/SapB family protein [Bacteriovorax sp. PP10]|uniref:MgtC/SapB family protein n=1 Tax=Bacteriovorax antarcticus TaxID=3088717 RepID=A0ABU5VYH5_9BACT|nr:MgtC/SapB family protein [Bacteriovorax sp. PP10]MEA9358121.1 MgtC/SapB family protein [Bacteriovorax sp. PP10]
MDHVTQTVYIEYLGNVDVYLGMGIKIVTGLVLGSLVGYDREQKMKNAGIKTNVLICLGATLYTAISMLGHVQGGGIEYDSARIPAQIVSGIGFLGAGAIMKDKGNIIGLTTAATIWVVASIGMTIGYGFPVIATIFTITILSVLKLLGPIYQGFESTKNHKYYHIEILSHGDIKNLVKEIVFNTTDRIDELHEQIIDKESNKRHIDFYVYLHPKKMRIMGDELRDIVQADRVHFHQIDSKAGPSDT